MFYCSIFICYDAKNIVSIPTVKILSRLPKWVDYGDILREKSRNVIFKVNCNVSLRMFNGKKKLVTQLKVVEMRTLPWI